MRPSREDIAAKLTAFIADELLGQDGGEGDPLSTDALDSLGLEQLVEYVEEEFGVSIRGEEMVRRNFKSIAALSAFVEAKLLDSGA